MFSGSAGASGFRLGLAFHEVGDELLALRADLHQIGREGLQVGRGKTLRPVGRRLAARARVLAHQFRSVPAAG